jgi:hypothetical protein
VQQACQTIVEWSIFKRTRGLRTGAAIVRGAFDEHR